MCGKGHVQMRRSAFVHSDGDTSAERGRGLKFGEPVVGKVEIFDLCPEGRNWFDSKCPPEKDF